MAQPSSFGGGAQPAASHPPPVKRILVRAPNWLGDLVMATPAFRALRGRYPGAQIHLHARPALLPLLEGTSWFDHLLPLRSYHQGIVALLREGLALRPVRFDLGLCMPDSLSAALLMRVACTGRVIGYAGPGRSLLLDGSPPRPPPTTPRERHCLGIVAALGNATRPQDDEGERLELPVPPEAGMWAAAFRTREGLRDTASTALLAPGASYGPAKQWPPGHFAELGDMLCEAGWQVALVGAPGEEPLCAAVRSGMRNRAWDWSGQLDLVQLKAVLSRVQLLICNDAGSRHVAVALGVPCVVLFGPTSLAKTALNLERVSALASPVGCRPCYHRHCPTDHRCMTRLRPAAVYGIARERLTTRSGDAGTLRGDPGDTP